MINSTCGTVLFPSHRNAPLNRSLALWEPSEVNQGLREHFAQSRFVICVTRCDDSIQRHNVDL